MGDVTVLIADDEVDVRRLVRHHLTRAGLRIVAEAADGTQVVDLATEHQPDVVLLDLRMPHLSGEEVLPHLVRACPRTMVAVLSALPREVHAVEVLARGAFAFYGKRGLHALPRRIAGDLERFQAALDGQETLPAWAVQPA